jgi:hypothetical protein
MNIKQAKRKVLNMTSAVQPLALAKVPIEQWPLPYPKGLKEVWRSRFFLVQVFLDNGVERLSICKATLKDNGNWEDNITWDELQRLKQECGRGDYEAVEVYPADKDIVNVANMRHLWIVPTPFSWKKVAE